MLYGFYLALGAGITYFIVLALIEFYGRYLLRKDAHKRAQLSLSHPDNLEDN